jgi:hypothetical protein
VETPSSDTDRTKRLVLGVCIALAILLVPVPIIVGGWAIRLAVYPVQLLLAAGVIWALTR